jgi:TRAP-type mannitol/chloroaromatic compound transport system permease small subunit
MATVHEAMLRVPPSAAKIVAALDNLNIRAGKLISWLILPMMFSLIYEVGMRYLFRSPTIWAMDLALILFGIHFMVGSPYCLQQGQHIRADFFYNKWSVRKKAAVDMCNYVIFFFPVHLVFLSIGWQYFYKSYQQNEMAISSPWMPYIWPAKMAIPVCIFLTILQGVSEFIKCRYRWKLNADPWPTNAHGVEEENVPACLAAGTPEEADHGN